MLDNYQPRVYNLKACANTIMQELQVNKELLLNNGQLQIHNPKIEINQQLTAKKNATVESIVWK